MWGMQLVKAGPTEAKSMEIEGVAICVPCGCGVGLDGERAWTSGLAGWRLSVTLDFDTC